MLLLAAVVMVYVQRFSFADEDWGYKTKGDLDSRHWYIKYQNCIGNRQSPIDIERSYIVHDLNLKPLTFVGYDKRIPVVNVTNEGHTVRIDIPESVGATITAKSLNATYKLKQFHFHWGHTDNVGSEHVLLGQRYPLEMHMVHADESVTYDKALTEPFGLLVISVLFRFGRENPELKRVTDHFRDIADPQKRTVTPVRDLDLIKLIPPKTSTYLQYAGSLTTPPCNEAVNWIILPHKGEISHAQMSNFRSLKREIEVNGKTIEVPFEQNDRNLQGIKGRKVHLFGSFDDLLV